MAIKKVHHYSAVQIAQLKPIKKQMYRSGLIAQSISPIKKADAYSIFQIAQPMLIKEQKVSEWASLLSFCQ